MILRRAPRRLNQTPRHVRIERVAPIGTVHGDGEQPGIEILEDHFICAHGFLLSLLLVVVSTPSFQHRHCERSEAIHLLLVKKTGLLRRKCSSQ